jgi:hypothetical protein
MIISNINRRFEVPWPLTGMTQVHNRVAESTTLINGEQYVYRAPVPYKTYNMSWAGGVEGVQPILDLYDGVYGKGPFYITEPLATLTGKNLLPPQWASCYMLADMANGWGSPQAIGSLGSPADNYVQFTGKAGASTKFPYPVTVPVVPGQQYFFTAWGGASAGATAGVLVSMFDRKAGAWSRTITYTLSASPTASTRVFTVPELQAEDITVLRITPFINTVGGTMWLWAMDLSTSDIFSEGDPLPVRTGRGVGALQFTGNISGGLLSTKIDRAGFSVDMAEVRPPLSS